MSNTSDYGDPVCASATMAPHFRTLTQTEGTIMNERKAFGTQFCPQYHTDVEFFIETSSETGRALIARYQDGGAEDLPIVEGRREFRAGIPDAWSEDDLMRFLALNQWP
jgi:hypothetical protein